MPIVRAMYLGWPGASEAYRFDGQYMLGDDLLVAPVTKPGAIAGKRVWFPPGRWIDVFTGAVHSGGAETLRVPLGRMPVFARAGAIVPRQVEPRVHGGQANPIALDVYAGANGSFDLYEDAGDGFGYQDGEFARTRFVWRGGRGALAIHGERGSFPDMRPQRRYVVRFIGVKRPREVTLTAAGRTRELHGWSYDPGTGRLQVATGPVGAQAGAAVRLVYSR